jgi:ribonuclease P protein subunit POP4
MSKQLIHATWIGKHARVAKAANKHNEGIEGMIVDETKTTITIETRKGEKKVPKHKSVFIIEDGEVEGDEALATPEDRITR